MQQPVEVSVEEGAEIVQRVCGIDVAKASGMICTRAPHDRLAARRVTKVWEVKATTKAISELADHLAAERVERVVLESTSDYWRPFVRHEAPFDRGEMKGLPLRAVAAAR
jgi:hypothetical protein